LAHELEIRGVTAWYSEAEITLGDSLRGRIDDGLCSSRFGVVVLSPHFFESPWSKAELDALASRAATEGRKVVLPVLHELTHEQLSRLSPTLGRVTHTSSREGVSAVVDKIVRAIKAANRAE
jgi:hypothetical protein